MRLPMRQRAPARATVASLRPLAATGAAGSGATVAALRRLPAGPATAGPASAAAPWRGRRRQHHTLLRSGDVVKFKACKFQAHVLSVDGEADVQPALAALAASHKSIAKATHSHIAAWRVPPPGEPGHPPPRNYPQGSTGSGRSGPNRDDEEDEPVVCCLHDDFDWFSSTRYISHSNCLWNCIARAATLTTARVARANGCCRCEHHSPDTANFP